MQHQNETSAHYQNNLYRLLRANNLTQYKDCHFKTRLCKQTIFSGLCISLGIPGIFPLDIMHLVNLNNPDLLLKLWHETIKMYPSDNIEHWDWCVLVGNVWQAHGKSVVMATLYIPSIISALVLPYSNTFLQRNIGSTTASISQMFASCSNGQSLQMIYNRDIGYSVELHKNSSSCIANGILIGSILSNIASISWHILLQKQSVLVHFLAIPNGLLRQPLQTLGRKFAQIIIYMQNHSMRNFACAIKFNPCNVSPSWSEQQWFFFVWCKGS